MRSLGGSRTAPTVGRACMELPGGPRIATAVRLPLTQRPWAVHGPPLRWAVHVWSCWAVHERPLRGEPYKGLLAARELFRESQEQRYCLISFSSRVDVRRETEIMAVCSIGRERRDPRGSGRSTDRRVGTGPQGGQAPGPVRGPGRRRRRRSMNGQGAGGGAMRGCRGWTY
jgi:hypothetical protein